MTLTREVWIAFDSFTASGYRTAIFLPPSISLASIFPIGATHLSNRCHPPIGRSGTGAVQLAIARQRGAVRPVLAPDRAGFASVGGHSVDARAYRAQRFLERILQRQGRGFRWTPQISASLLIKASNWRSPPGNRLPQRADHDANAGHSGTLIDGDCD